MRSRYRSTKYVIGGERFPTKKAVEERIRGILHDHELGKLEGADRIFALAFFALHPNIRKVETMSEVFVVRHPMGHRTFEIEKHGGKRLDISYKKPLRVLTGLDSHKADVLLAMRQAVTPQIRAFRIAAWRDSGGVIEPDKVVDHAYPDTFDALVKRFFQEHDADFADVRLVGGGDRLGKELEEGWWWRWTEFHKENAVLRLVDRGENSRWGKRDPAECGGEQM